MSKFDNNHYLMRMAHPTNFDYRIKLIQSLIDSKKTKEALMELSDSLLVFKDEDQKTQLYILGAKAYIADTQYSTARIQCKKALDIQPDNEEANQLMSEILFLKRDVEDSIQFCKLYLQKHPENPLLYEQLGFIYKRLNKLTHAIKQYKLSLQYGEKNFKLRLIRARLLFKAMLYEEALEEFLYLEHHSIKNDRIFYYIASSYTVQQKYDLAIEYYEKAI